MNDILIFWLLCMIINVLWIAHRDPSKWEPGSDYFSKEFVAFVGLVFIFIFAPICACLSVYRALEEIFWRSISWFMLWKKKRRARYALSSSLEAFSSLVCTLESKISEKDLIGFKKVLNESVLILIHKVTQDGDGRVIADKRVRGELDKMMAFADSLVDFKEKTEE